ncbi:hypothetical protein GQ457_10G013830 [Hibiscus cannabinus]
MKTVFSVEDSSAGRTMNPSASEGAFLKFVDKKGEDGEEGGDLEKNGATSFNNGFSESNVPLDQASLMNKLDFASAALALANAMSSPCVVKPQDSAARADCGSHSQTTDTLRFGSKATSKGAGDKDGNGRVGFPLFLSGLKKSGARVRPIKIGSSSDPVEGVARSNQSIRWFKIFSKRESARRSRRRKQAHLSQLKTSVAQLRLKKAAFVKQYNDISQKYNNALITNRMLKAEVEALKARVKLAEEMFERIYGYSYGSTEGN